MKLTTKLLKEMIEQELYEMEHEGSVNYIAVSMDGREMPIDAERAEILMGQGYIKVREDALDGSNNTTIFLYHPDSPEEPGNIPIPQGSAGDIVNH